MGIREFKEDVDSERGKLSIEASAGGNDKHKSACLIKVKGETDKDGRNSGNKTHVKIVAYPYPDEKIHSRIHKDRLAEFVERNVSVDVSSGVISIG